MVTQEKIFDALRSVVDPELGINVVDLGLIYSVDMSDQYIHVTMTLTTPGCPLHGSMSQAVERAVKMFDPAKEVMVDVVWEPAWTPERMSEHARKMLGW